MTTMMSRKLLPTLLLIVLSLGASACRILGPDDPASPQTEENRAVWDAIQTGTYDYELFRGCFCGHSGWFVVDVVDDRISHVRGRDTDQVIPVEDYDQFWTIDDLFDLIDEADADADDLEVTWSDTGWPVKIDIDWIRGAVDDELVVEVANVQIPLQ